MPTYYDARKVPLIASALCSLAMWGTAVAAPAKRQASVPASRNSDAGTAFTSNEITLLYEACTQSGGSVSIRGDEFSCSKTGRPLAAKPEAQSAPPPAFKPSPRKGKYSGAQLSDMNAEGGSSDITRVHTIGEVVPLIRVGVTTRDQIVAALKEPATSQFDSTGMETTAFVQNVSLGKSGGFMQLLTQRGPVKKVLVVMFKQGVVSYFTVQDRR